jgi:1-acyl-sn-glycerol-3-phosphate acyltransferase
MKGFYGILRRISRPAVSLFYREVTVVGAEELPEGSLVIVAGPHANHMQDSVIVGDSLGRDDVYFLAYSTLFQDALLGIVSKRLPEGETREKLERWDNTMRLAVLRAFNMIPINRAQDGKDSASDRRENFAFIDEAAKRIAAGGTVVIYPDGGSPSGYALGQIQAGAALLAIRAAAFAQESGAGEPSLVCVSLTYSGFYEPFHSGVSITFGKPIPLGDWVTRSRTKMKATRKALAAEFERQIRSRAVIAPVNDPLRIEQIGWFLRDQTNGTVEQVRTASSLVAEIATWEEDRRASLYAKLDDYFSLIGCLSKFPGRLLPSATSRESTYSWIPLALAPLTYAGLLLHTVPVQIVRARTKKFPEELYLRGQQVFGTSMAVFGVWYVLLASIVGEQVLTNPGRGFVLFLGLLVNAGLGALAARLLLETNSAVLPYVDSERYKEVCAQEASIRSELGILPAEQLSLDAQVSDSAPQ